MVNISDGEIALPNLYLASQKKGALANSEDPDQTPRPAASDQELHCLH